MTTFQGTETYLIECSRENSAINIDDDDDTNGSWSNETEFNLKRGDRLSVEMVCANIRGSGTSAPTIEFSGQNVVVNGGQKPYCDTKVLIEVFFYMNNNNTYSVGMPLIHPFGGINGLGGHGNYDNLVTPTNLCPRIPKGNVTNQVCNYREVNLGEGYVYPAQDDYTNTWGIWDGTPPEPVYLNQPGNEYPPKVYFTSQDTTPGTAETPFDRAYQIYQFEIESSAGVKTMLAAGVSVTTALLGVGGRISAIRITPHAAVTIPQTTPPFQPYNNNMCFTDFENGIIGGRTGQDLQNNFYVGNHIFISNNQTATTGTPEFDWVGEVSRIKGIGGLGVPNFNMKVLQLEIDSNNTPGAQEFGNYGGAASFFDFDCGDCACYVGGIYVDLAGFVNAKFDIKPGSSQEGLINYDNLELSTIPQVAGGKYAGNGYMRGNNNLFNYSRNTRKPQLGQNPSLALFPDTLFEPDVVIGSTPPKPFYTTDAGEYGNLPAGAQFGYRNANIQQENNNDPYIFMRNDHFGKGRRGMNNEKMPDAEPMTAFIYVSLEELLQDVNSVTNVINERLRETITGIGTTTQQTSKLLVNSIENPEQRRPASNVVPFYNRVGFYDRSVTAGGQNTLMLDTNNAQYRNIITDIIPIKNGGCVKVNPANFVSGRNYLAQSFGKQYGGIPSIGEFGNNATQSQLDNIKETTYLREIQTSSDEAIPVTEDYVTNTYIPEVPAVPEVPAYTIYTPQPDIYTPEVPEVPEVPESTIIYNSTADGSVALVSDFDVANNVSPMALGNGAKLFTDDGGLNANYSTSHSRHATFDAGAGNCIYINPRAFEYEHSTYSMYDRMGITCSNTIGGLSTSSGNLSSVDSSLSQYLYQSSQADPSVFWGTSWVSGNGGYGTGGGWIFPNTDGTDVKGNNNSSWINTWYKIDARYVRFWFKSDGSATEPGWDILVARAVVTPAVPAIPAVPGYYTPQPDLETLVPAVPAVPAVPGYFTTITSSLVVSTEEFNEVNYQGWANPIYGNMATADLYKYQLGDRWANLPTWDCDRIVSSAGVPLNRDVGKHIILNNKLEYNKLEFTFPQGANDYTGDLSNFPNSEPSNLMCNNLYESQLIYTNIPFPNADDADGSWVKFAKAMRNYETYYNPINKAPVTYKQQRADIANWIFDGDVGMTDDRSTAQLRTQLGAPRHEPPNTAPDYPPVAPPNPIPAVPVPRFQNNRPFYNDWINKPSTEASLTTDPVYGTSLGLPENGTDYRPVSYGTDRTLICPTTSHEIFAGVSATNCVDFEDKYKILKELGRLKMKSRFNQDFYKIAKNYKGGDIATQSTLPVDNNEVGFRLSNNPPDPDYKVNTDFMRLLDLGFYPYEYKRGDGTTITLCALMVGTEYIANEDKISTINFGSMVWGQSIGISNSFYDNHAICPMNNDQVKRGQPLTKTTQVPGEYIQVGQQDTIEVEQNEYYQAPSSTTPFAATLAYTQTIGYTPPRIKCDWDFTTNFASAPYLNSNARFRCKLQFSECLQFPGRTSQVIWEQSSLLTAGAVTDFTRVSTDTPDFYDPTNPAGMNFTGLYFNPLFNGDNTSPTPNPPTATNTWVLVSGTGVQNFNPASPYENLGIGLFQARGLGEPGAYFNAYFDSGADEPRMVQFSMATLSVYRVPTIVPSADTITPNLGLEHNKVNYVWVGATQPTFQYAQDKGRVEFQQLQDDNILNQKSIPYSASTINPSSTTGTKAGIINTAAEDAVFSRNSREDDFVDSKTTAPVKNSGIRAEISGVGIYKIWLCPENYEPPNNINLSCYWNNAASGENVEGSNEISYWGQTEINRAKITNTCVEADEANWTGSLFERLGFQSHRELLPAYGKQQNRFNPSTYNSTRPDKISRGTKPLILCNAVDNSIDPALNTFYTLDASGSSVNGIPMYSNGMLNDESVSLQLVNQTLTASAPPILSTSPFLLIESDICSTNYRSGRTQQNVLFYLMKNYQASSFIYGYGSSYTHTANQDRTISLINTAFRDPITGRLQKCSNNSTIIYKIQRDVTILPPTTDALGNPLPIPQARETESEKLLKQIVTNTDKQGSASGGAIGTGTGGGSKTPPNVPLFQSGLLQQVQEEAGANVDILGGAQAIQALQQTFEIINNDPNITPTEAEIQSATAFTIQQLIATIPIELVRSAETGQIGMANPSQNLSGEGYGSSFLNANSAGDALLLSRYVTQYLTSSLDKLGGLPAIRSLMENGDNAEVQSEELAKALNQIVINPLTGAQVGEFGETKLTETGLNEFGYLTFAERNSETFVALSTIMTQYLTNQEKDDAVSRDEVMVFRIEQARLMDIMANTLTGAIRAGNRISLADPQQEWIQPQLGGQLEGLTPRRYDRMRQVNTQETAADEYTIEGGYSDETARNYGFKDLVDMNRENRENQQQFRTPLSFEANIRQLNFDDDYDDEPYTEERWEQKAREKVNEGLRGDINEQQATPPGSPRMSGETKRGYDNLKPLPPGSSQPETREEREAGTKR